jgi:hypothetical protein
MAEAGQILIEAKAALPHGQFEKMIETKLTISSRKAQMLMRIAEHPILSNPKCVLHLPASWGTLYDLTQLPVPALEAALAQHEITPGTRRSDVKQLGIHLFAELPKALQVLNHFAQNWPKPDALVDELVKQDCGNWTDDMLYELGKLPAWITKLQGACQREGEENATRHDKLIAEMEQELKTEVADARGRNSAARIRINH